jgi:hypothetical protein
MLILAPLLLSGVPIPPPPQIYVSRPPKARVAEGSFDDMSRVEDAAKRCGFEDIGFAVPDGFEYATYISLNQQELRGAKAECLRVWRAGQNLPSARWIDKLNNR